MYIFKDNGNLIIQDAEVEYFNLNEVEAVANSVDASGIDIRKTFPAIFFEYTETSVTKIINLPFPYPLGQGIMEVLVNGTSESFTETDENTITMDDDLAINDDVEIRKYDIVFFNENFEDLVKQNGDAWGANRGATVTALNAGII
ncbi:MAG: hypothetical protein ACRBG0_27710 [Lewinella sp.]|uniref:hypothetical protein n=1 Tax=Lewinella sp. TaxID=2004506 RepID=UPI003D6BFD30